MASIPLSAYAQLDKAKANEYDNGIEVNPKGYQIVNQTYIWYKKNYSEKNYKDLKSKIGWVYPVNSYIQHIKNGIDGRVGFDTTYSINEFGLRTVENSTDRANHLILAGDSNTFGIGVKDEETLSEIMSKKYPQYHTYNFGHGGGGPHNTLALIEKTSWNKLIHETSGRMIYIFYPEWMLSRVIGSKDYLSWDKGRSPWYEVEDDHVVYKGSFTKRLLTKALNFIRLIDPYHWVGDLPKINQDHINLITKIFEKMQAEYLLKFPDGKFTVALSYYASESYEVIDQIAAILKKSGIDTAILHKAQKRVLLKYHLLDMHFNYEGQKMVENELSRAIKF